MTSEPVFVDFKLPTGARLPAMDKREETPFAQGLKEILGVRVRMAQRIQPKLLTQFRRAMRKQIRVPDLIGEMAYIER